jgi:UDP-GlcNAc:undecaprenyl-phosphate/decaprenyl-phosphate GlcNAc-1-phosphate transferase
MAGYFLVAVCAALVSTALMPLCRAIALRFGVVAQPDDERRLHTVATPLLGGVAMCCGVLAALGLAAALPQFDGVFASSSELIGIGIAAVVITTVGVIDDVLEISAPAKLAGMVAAGGVLYALGVVMYYVRIPVLGILSLSPDLVPLLTVLWVIGMANAINLIDGLDGLAAGIVGISAAAFFLYADRLFDNGLLPGDDNSGPLIAAITVGVCVGFLPWNFSPARLFMGDAGALLLGLLVAASTMVVGGRADPSSTFRGQTYFFVAPLFIPFVILAVPMIDTLLAIIRRTVAGKNPALADRHHIHHRLVDLGHGPRRAVVILWSMTLIFSGLALVPVYISGRWPLIPLGIAFVATLAFAILHKDSSLWQGRAAATAETVSAEPRIETAVGATQVLASDAGSDAGSVVSVGLVSADPDVIDLAARRAGTAQTGTAQIGTAQIGTAQTGNAQTGTLPTSDTLRSSEVADG